MSWNFNSSSPNYLLSFVKNNLNFIFKVSTSKNNFSIEKMKIFCFLTVCAADRFTPENSVLMQSLIKQGIRGAGFTSRRGI